MTAVELPVAVALPERRGVGLGRVLRSEWDKSWGLRSTRLAVATTVALTVLFAALTGFDSLVGADGYGHSAAYVAAGGLLFSQLPLLVYGVLMGAGEFSTGSATTTFAAVPRRTTVVVAKTVTVAATAAVTVVVALALSVVLAMVSPLGSDLQLALDDGLSVRILGGGALAMTLLAVLALGVGMAVRRPLIAIALMFGLGLSELALMGADGLAQWLPGHALMTVTALPDFLDLAAAPGQPVAGPWGSVGVLGAWSLLALVLAASLLRRSDV
jgi:ABC-2 type transport system permease protein